MIGVKVWIYQIKTLMSVWVSHEPCRNTVKFEYHLINHYRNITPLAVCVDPRIYRNLHVVWLAQSAPPIKQLVSLSDNLYSALKLHFWQTKINLVSYKPAVSFLLI